MYTNETEYKKLPDKNDEAFLSITKLIDMYYEIKEDLGEDPYCFFERLMLSKLLKEQSNSEFNVDYLNFNSFLFPYELCGYRGAELASIYSDEIVKHYERFSVSLDNKCKILKYTYSISKVRYIEDLEKQYDNLPVLAYISILFDQLSKPMEPSKKHNYYGKLINICKEEGIGESCDIADEFSKGIFGYKLIGRVGNEEVVYTFGKRINNNYNTRLKVVKPKSSEEIYDFIDSMEYRINPELNEPEDVINVRKIYYEINSFIEQLIKQKKLLDSLKDFNKTIPIFDKRQKSIYSSKIEYAKQDLEETKNEILQRISNLESILKGKNSEISKRPKSINKENKIELALATLMVKVNENAYKKMKNILAYKRTIVNRIIWNKVVKKDEDTKYKQEISDISLYFE